MRNYRIQGVTTGCYSKVPLQNTFLTLPIQLMPEEAAYLRDTGHAVFVNEASMVQMPTLLDAAIFQTARDEQFTQQVRWSTLAPYVHFINNV